jgi:hypothetical protein
MHAGNDMIEQEHFVNGARTKKEEDPRRKRLINQSDKTATEHHDQDGITSGATQQPIRDAKRKQGPLEEAAAVLHAMGDGDSYLDGFNLLGVIANPRGAGGVGSNNRAHTSTTPTAATSNTSYFESLESTITSVTEQMEVFNAVLEGWSRQMMDDPQSAYATDDSVPESQLSELPRELQLSPEQQQPLQRYRDESGAAAHAFQVRMAAEQEHPSLLSCAASALEDGISADVPALFFQTDFDLTDPATFRELLLLPKQQQQQQQQHQELDTTNNNDHDPAETMTDTSGPLPSWFLLPPPDAFSSYLDHVEMALLHQVRSRSGAFLEESYRFAQLQQDLQTLLQHVVRLNDTFANHVQHDWLEPMLETVPSCDQHRAALHQLLRLVDRADAVLSCKGRVARLLSGTGATEQDNDARYAQALEQIQYGRTLFMNDTNGDDTSSSTMELRRVHALTTVADQFDQYEQLVVAHLRDELVEIFLEWNLATAGSSSSTYGYAHHHHFGGNSLSSKASQLELVQNRVREVVAALKQCRALAQARDAYSSRLQDVVRMTVRTTVAEFAADSEHGSTVSTGTTGMTLERFLDCLDMLFEQIMALLKSAASVNEFCMTESLDFSPGTKDGTSATIADSDETPQEAVTGPVGPLALVVTSAAELSTKSISELVRLRKEAHSLVTLEELKQIWDKCMLFTTQAEELGGHKASALRSTLLAQAKAFVERKHESNMSSLVAALDSERWSPCEVKAERQANITKLCTGRSLVSSAGSRETDDIAGNGTKKKSVEVEGVQYSVVWSCLLLMEMVINNIATASFFPTLASTVVAKVGELLRLFSTRTNHLVLGAGAIQSAARLKTINARHLSCVTQCLGMIIALIPHIRAALMAHLPPRQHTLLTSLDQIRKECAEHNEKILNKFVTIIGGIVEVGLAPKIQGTDFDARMRGSPPGPAGPVSCCIFFEGVSSNTRKMHEVLAALLPSDHLQDVFSRIFSFVDQKIPSLFIAASEQQVTIAGVSSPSFSFPTTNEGKKRMLLEAEVMTKNLNDLAGVYPWDFTIVSVLGKHMMYELYPVTNGNVLSDASPDARKNEDQNESDNRSESPIIESDPLPVNELTKESNGTAVDIEHIASNGTELTVTNGGASEADFDLIAKDPPMDVSGSNENDIFDGREPSASTDAQNNEYTAQIVTDDSGAEEN